MSAQSSREQEVRDTFDSWSIGERFGKPLGKFGSAVDRVIRPIPLIAEMPADLDPTLWRGYEEWLDEREGAR